MLVHNGAVCSARLCVLLTVPLLRKDRTGLQLFPILWSHCRCGPFPVDVGSIHTTGLKSCPTGMLGLASTSKVLDDFESTRIRKNYVLNSSDHIDSELLSE